jgi:hypothetical protein
MNAPASPALAKGDFRNAFCDEGIDLQDLLGFGMGGWFTVLGAVIFVGLGSLRVQVGPYIYSWIL